MMYRFEWNYKEIEDQKSFEKFVNNMKKEETGVNYEQAARLFYEGTYEGKEVCIMVELQIPTKDMIDLENPWLDAYEVKHIHDYDASNEIASVIGNGDVITFDNAENLMLAFAKDMCDKEEE